jgi:DNA-binding response OmpR family regulator
MSDTPARILVVDDDPGIREVLCDYLVQHGYQARGAASAAEMDRALASGPTDLIVLDLMMPGEDGLSVVRRLSGTPPVVMLSAMGEDTDRIVGLELGADDYLAKPCNPRELLARIRAVLRRHGGGSAANGQLMRFGSMEIDRDARTITIAGKPCELTSYQFDLLLAMAERAGRVLSRDQIMEAVRGRELDAFDRSIDVHMGRIRAAIEADPKQPRRILTVRGVGYMFKAEVRRG